jgi:C1A family cysteine protease
MQRRYGWIPSTPDQRDALYSRVMPVPADLPSQVDLRPHLSPVEDQGPLGSCTAQALVGLLEFLELKEFRDQGLKQPFTDFSRLFLYYNERVIEHTVNSDSGAMIRDGIKSLAKQGCCDESLWPYDISKFMKKPPAVCYTQAMNFQILKYYRIQTLLEMRTCLASGFPFVFGFSVYESFQSEAVTKTGIVPMPKWSERLLGGHAVVAVGYTDKDRRFIVRNSWGTDWGQKGYFTIPYQYLNSRFMADDFWAIKLMEE